MFPKFALGQGLSHQGRPHGGELRNDQLVETADDVGPAVAAHGPRGQGAPQDVVELQHLRAARHLQDVLGIGRIGGGDDGDPLAQLPDGEGDVRVDFVTVGGDDQGRPVGTQPPVGFGVVDIPHGHPDAHVVKFQGALEIVHDEDIVDPVILQLLDQGHGDRIVAGDDHVAPASPAAVPAASAFSTRPRSRGHRRT